MSERSMDLKRRWRDGEITYGAWMAIGSTAVAEIMATTGFDWVFIDTEHTAIDYDTLQNVLAGFNGSNTVPVVRVPWNDHVLIKKALDIGAEGILAPMVRTPEEARDLVAACKYPPEGRRGFGPFRASGWYRDEAYTTTANETLIVMPQIEHVDTIAVIDEVVSVPGIDAVCMGPADISGSVGVPLQIDHPAVQDAMAKVCAAASAAGLPSCLAIPFPPDVQLEWAARGARLLVATVDVNALCDATTEKLNALRKAAESA